MHILLIEDNLAIAVNLYDYLEAQGHSVEAARDGASGFRLAASQHFDVILLDLGLPKMDGIDLCRKLREQIRLDTPILIITARDTLKDKLAGFESGADDYLVKPFALEEVQARLIALHKRRTGKIISRLIKIDDLHYDSTHTSVKFAGAVVPLPPICMRLLELLMTKSDRIVSRKEMEYAVWDNGQQTSDRVRYHMHILRRALVSAGGRDPIETVHGVGFRLPKKE